MRTIILFSAISLCCCACYVIHEDLGGISWGEPLEDYGGYRMHSTALRHGPTELGEVSHPKARFELPNPRRPWLVGVKAHEYKFYIASDWAYNACIDFSRRSHDMAASTIAQGTLRQRAGEAAKAVLKQYEDGIRSEARFAIQTAPESDGAIVDGREYQKLGFRMRNLRTKAQFQVEVYAHPFAYDTPSEGTVRFYLVRVVLLLNEARSQAFKQEAREYLRMILRSIEFPDGPEMIRVPGEWSTAPGQVNGSPPHNPRDE